MDIVEFFQISSGKWFSQRTSHHLTFQQSESGKSNLEIEALETDSSDVLKVCELHRVDPSQALCGVRITWDGTMEWDAQKKVGTAILVAIANPDDANQGQLLRLQGTTQSVPGHYTVGTDEAVTLITRSEGQEIEERIWFASPNLRFRTSVLKQADGFSMASFCSEIRLGVKKPPEQ